MKPCACDQCRVPLEPSYSIAYRDGYCEFCATRCYPVYHAGTTQSRLCLTPQARAQIHQHVVPVGEPTTAIKLGEALQQAFIEHGIPLLKQEANRWIRKLLTRR